MNANEALLQRLINDPALMKKLEKMASAIPLEKKAKKMKELGLAKYVNQVTSTCKLCGSESIIFTRMDWDSEEKLYRVGCHHQDNIWPLLPLHNLRQRRPSCNLCQTVLLTKSKEDLIKHIIWLADRA